MLIERKKKTTFKKFFFFFTRSSRLFTSQSLFAENIRRRRRRMKTSKRHHHHHIQLDSLSRLLRLTAARPFVATNDVIISQKKNAAVVVVLHVHEKKTLSSPQGFFPNVQYKNIRKKGKKISCHQDDTVVQYQTFTRTVHPRDSHIRSRAAHRKEILYRTCSSSSALLIAFLHFLDVIQHCILCEMSDGPGHFFNVIIRCRYIFFFMEHFHIWTTARLASRIQ